MPRRGPGIAELEKMLMIERESRAMEMHGGHLHGLQERTGIGLGLAVRGSGASGTEGRVGGIGEGGKDGGGSVGANVPWLTSVHMTKALTARAVDGGHSLEKTKQTYSPPPPHHFHPPLPFLSTQYSTARPSGVSHFMRVESAGRPEREVQEVLGEAGCRKENTRAEMMWDSCSLRSVPPGGWQLSLSSPAGGCGHSSASRRLPFSGGDGGGSSCVTSSSSPKELDLFPMSAGVKDGPMTSATEQTDCVSPNKVGYGGSAGEDHQRRSHVLSPSEGGEVGADGSRESWATRAPAWRLERAEAEVELEKEGGLGNERPFLRNHHVVPGNKIVGFPEPSPMGTAMAGKLEKMERGKGGDCIVYGYWGGRKDTEKEGGSDVERLANGHEAREEAEGQQRMQIQRKQMADYGQMGQDRRKNASEIGRLSGSSLARELGFKGIEGGGTSRSGPSSSDMQPFLNSHLKRSASESAVLAQPSKEGLLRGDWQEPENPCTFAPCLRSAADSNDSESISWVGEGGSSGSGSLKRRLMEDVLAENQVFKGARPATYTRGPLRGLDVHSSPAMPLPKNTKLWCWPDKQDAVLFQQLASQVVRKDQVMDGCQLRSRLQANLEAQPRPQTLMMTEAGAIACVTGSGAVDRAWNSTDEGAWGSSSDRAEQSLSLSMRDSWHSHSQSQEPGCAQLPSLSVGNSSSSPSSSNARPGASARSLASTGSAMGAEEVMADGLSQAVNLVKNMINFFGEEGVRKLARLIREQEATYNQQVEALHQALKVQHEIAAEARLGKLARVRGGSSI